MFEEMRCLFPSAAALAASSDDALALLTSSLGLHWRGPLLRSTAAIVAATGGQPPLSYEKLLQLPGVGPYAASAWLSLHRGRRAPIVDSNVARWLCRLTGNQYHAESRRSALVLRLADELTPKTSYRDYNYAVLDFTMTICKPSNPLCHECPLLSLCDFGASRAIKASKLTAAGIKIRS